MRVLPSWDCWQTPCLIVCEFILPVDLLRTHRCLGSSQPVNGASNYYLASSLELDSLRAQKPSHRAPSSRRFRRSWGSQAWEKQHVSYWKIPDPSIFPRKLTPVSQYLGLY